MLLGVAAPPDHGQLAPEQPGRNDGARGPAGQACGQRGLNSLGIAEGEQGLAHARTVRRHPAAHARSQLRRIPASQLLDVDDIGLAQHGQVHGLAGRFGQVGQHRRGRLAQAQLRGRAGAQLEQSHAEPVPGARTLHQAPARELSQDPVRGGLSDPGTAAQLG